MKTAIALAGLIILAAGLALDCQAQENADFWNTIKDPATLGQLKSFVAAKEAQANTAAKASGKVMPAEFKTFFAAADRGNWLAVSNIFEDVCQRNGQFISTNQPDWRLRGIPWSALQEIWGAFAAFDEGDEKYSRMFGDEIICSIPAGSIYFGGTDPGRFIVTAMQKSQINGEPFFTLTQNALTDGLYLDYLRSMYGKEIYIPTAEDSQRCFTEYYDDVEKRLKTHQLSPDEVAQVGPDGKLQLSGPVDIMHINGFIAKIIFDRETNREFYVEESYPLDWMYPYLEPHGLIFKLNHEPLTELSDDTIQQDHDYWVKTVAPLIGDWLNDDTSIQDVTNFAQKVFLKHDYSGFTGARGYVENKYASSSFAWDRSNIARLYVWRMNQATSADEKARMAGAADFAFRQAVALCPFVKQTADDYADFLASQNRAADAALVHEMARQFPNWRF